MPYIHMNIWVLSKIGYSFSGICQKKRSSSSPSGAGSGSGGWRSFRLVLLSCGPGIPASSRHQKYPSIGHRCVWGTDLAEPGRCSRTGTPPDCSVYHFRSLRDRDARSIPGSIHVRPLADRLRYGACLLRDTLVRRPYGMAPGGHEERCAGIFEPAGSK